MDADPPPADSGVSAAGEWVEVGFALTGTAATTSVLDAVADGGLALNVQGIAQPGGGDESEWFTSFTIVPEPASLVLLAVGLGAALVLERRRLGIRTAV